MHVLTLRAALFLRGFSQVPLTSGETSLFWVLLVIVKRELPRLLVLVLEILRGKILSLARGLSQLGRRFVKTIAIPSRGMSLYWCLEFP